MTKICKTIFCTFVKDALNVSFGSLKHTNKLTNLKKNCQGRDLNPQSRKGQAFQACALPGYATLA